jgi:hypothetical protein
MGRRPGLDRRTFLLAALGLALPLGRRVAASTTATDDRRGTFSARAAILYGLFRFEERGTIDESIDRAAGRYTVRIRGRGPETTTEIDAAGMLRDGRWTPTRFRDRFVVYGRESRLDIGYHHDRGVIEYRGRSETFMLRRPRVADDVVPIPAGTHVDDALSATLNFAEERWPPEPDGTLLTRVVRRRRGPREGGEERAGAYPAELVPFSLRVATDRSGQPVATIDMTRFSSWAQEDEPARIVFGPDRRPETITATLMLGTSIEIRLAAPQATSPPPGGLAAARKPVRPGRSRAVGG